MKANIGRWWEKKTVTALGLLLCNLIIGEDGPLRKEGNRGSTSSTDQQEVSGSTYDKAKAEFDTQWVQLCVSNTI